MSWPVNARTGLMMDAAEAIYGATITATQGSPHPGVDASFGTHDGEGVIDVDGADLDAIVAAMREVGFAAWHRTRAEGFAPHVHGVAYMEPDLSPSAADQITDYLEGRNGLATNAPDDGPRDWVGRTWEDYLAGNPGGGEPFVFRGTQLGVYDIVVNAGGATFGDIYNGLTGRDDGTTVTLNVGDEFYLYTTAADTNPTDVYSMAHWRLSASGHGTLALADSHDETYTYAPPFDWNDLGNVTIDRDDLALTATAATTGLVNYDRVWNGGLLLRVTCTAGTVTLDWACLQVEPPAGLLITAGSHWSPWRAPSLVPHQPAGSGAGTVVGAGAIWPDPYAPEDAPDVIAELLGQAVENLAGSTWDPVSFSPAGDNGYLPIEASAGVAAFTRNNSGGHAEVGMSPTFMALQWGVWPDYRIEPPELDPLVEAGEVAVVGGDPQYEFADGSTSSIRWDSFGLSLFWVNELGLQLTPEFYPVNWNSLGSAGYGSNSGGTGPPNFTSAGSISAGGEALVPFQPAGGDFLLSASVSQFNGSDLDFEPSNGEGWNYVEPGNPNPIQSVFFNLKAIGLIAVLVQMPNFRYLVNDWIRSPDALDTSDPEGVVVTWLRQRQRDDGLGSSVVRAKRGSSRQLSLRQRGYR